MSSVSSASSPSVIHHSPSQLLTEARGDSAKEESWHDNEFAPIELQPSMPEYFSLQGPRTPDGSKPFGQSEGPSSPYDMVCFDARNTLIALRRFAVPSYLAAGFEREACPSFDSFGRPCVDVCVDAVQMHRVLDFHRDGKVPVSMPQYDVDLLKHTASYLSDETLLHELKVILPLRVAVKRSRGEMDHAASLFRLADALQKNGQLERARRKSDKAHEIIRKSCEGLTDSPPEPWAHYNSWRTPVFERNTGACMPAKKDLSYPLDASEEAPLLDMSIADAQAAQLPWLEPLSTYDTSMFRRLAPPPLSSGVSDESSSHSLSTAMDFFARQAPNVVDEDWVDARASATQDSCPTARAQTPATC